MKKRNDNNHHLTQQGFTVLELLIAMTLMLSVVLAVQLFISGVVVDQENISARHDQETQTRIALSNMQRDVALAGSNAQVGVVNTVLGITPVVNAAGVINSIVVSRIDANADAKDCNGNSVGSNIVTNTYSIAADSNGVAALRCNGSGGNVGNRAHVNDVVSMSFSLSGLDNNGNFTSSPAANQVNMVSLCIVQSETTTRRSVLQPTAQDCNGVAILPIPGRKFIRTHIDMPVYSSTFIAGSP